VTDGSPLPQLEYRWLGGIKTILGRLTFYRGTLTFAMIIPVAYQDTAFLQALFPNVGWFALGLLAVLGVAGIVEYAIVYPSQIKFNKGQAARNGRDPIYQQVTALREDIDELEDRLEDVSDD
jgi:hypothetical protein